MIENMSGFTAPDGQRFTIFGEGGGQTLADTLGVPLLGKVPLEEALREHADSGDPLATAEPDSAASIAIRQAARGIIASTPVELPLMQLSSPRLRPRPPRPRRSAAWSCRSSRPAADQPRSARVVVGGEHRRTARPAPSTGRRR